MLKSEGFFFFYRFYFSCEISCDLRWSCKEAEPPAGYFKHYLGEDTKSPVENEC